MKRAMAPARAALALAIVFSAEGAAAHETWLAPSRYSAAPGTSVRLDLTSGMSFPQLEGAIRPARVHRSGVRAGGLQAVLGPWTERDSSLAAMHGLSGPGLVAAWVELGPRDIRLDDEQVEEYFEEIGAGPALREQWNARRGRVPWDEVYTKHAKTFVRAGDASGDSSWREPVGMGVELVPRFSPAGARAGDSVAVLLLRSGRPEPGATVGLMQGPERRAFAVTDTNGIATFALGRPGPVLLFTVLLRPAGERWESDFSTLTFEARPREAAGR